MDGVGAEGPHERVVEHGCGQSVAHFTEDWEEEAVLAEHAEERFVRGDEEGQWESATGTGEFIL